MNAATKRTHTPGPWVVLPEEAEKPYIRVRGKRLGGRYKIANALMPVYDGPDGCEVQEARANARLIAAAPKFYSEAEDFLFEYEHLSDADLESHLEYSDIYKERELRAVQAFRDLINDVRGDQ